jgi:hypothetical protein
MSQQQKELYKGLRAKGASVKAAARFARLAYRNLSAAQ